MCRAYVKSRLWRFGPVVCLGIWCLVCLASRRVDAAADVAPAPSLSKIVTSYSLISANDQADRDPLDWRLLGTSNGGKTWIPLDSRKGEVFSERLQKRTFTIANKLPFNLFRFEVNALNNPVAANSMQLAELELNGTWIGNNRIEENRLFAEIVSCSGEYAPVEAADKAFDGLTSTKWLDFLKVKPLPKTNISWVQWQYRLGQPLLVTNYSQLTRMTETKLKARQPIQFEAAYLGRDRKSGREFLSDLTNLFTAQSLHVMEGAKPGDRLVLKGTTGWGESRPTILESRVEHSELPRLQRSQVQLGEPIATNDANSWVETEGVAGFIGQKDSDAYMELESGTARVTVKVIGADAGSLSRFLNKRIRLHGLRGLVPNEND